VIVKVIELAELLGEDVRRLKRWEKDELPKLYKNNHDKMNTQGCTARLINTYTMEIVSLDYGGWTVKNGKMTDSEPNYDPYEGLTRKGAVDGDILVIHRWNHLTQSDTEFDDLFFHKITCKDLLRGAEARAKREEEFI